MELGEYIAKYRKEAGVTLDDLAARSGVPKGTINKIIAGTTKSPTLETVCSIANALGKTINDFMDPPQGSKKTAPLYSSEAAKIAKDYDSLDHWGKAAVRSVADTELARMQDEARFLAETSMEPEPKVVNLFTDPSAAGPALGITGQSCEPYTLTPNDPQGAAYAVRVQGDSMEPDFPDGSIAFVNHDQMRDGDIGVFCVDGATVIKQWHYDPVLGISYLFSLNRKRNDCDLVIMNSSNRSLVWQGRVLTRRRYDLPGMV